MKRTYNKQKANDVEKAWLNANEEQTNSPGERCTGAKRVFVSSRVARARQNINVIDIWTTLYKKKTGCKHCRQGTGGSMDEQVRGHIRRIRSRYSANYCSVISLSTISSFRTTDKCKLIVYQRVLALIFSTTYLHRAKCLFLAY